MTSFVSLCAVTVACMTALVLRKKKTQDLCSVLMTFVLPFAAGGFHGYTAAICGMIIAAFLLSRKQLTIYVSLGFAALLTVFLAACITPFWAADRGMAWFGVLRWIPVLLYAIYLMQLSPEKRADTLSLVPLCGAVMTFSSAVLLIIPGMAPYVTVNGRLAGFFQYPNTYAMFLLAGLILQNFHPWEEKKGMIITALLSVGIVLSGSRTVFMLLLAAAAGILMLKGRTVKWVELIAGIVLALCIGLIMSRTGSLFNANRYTAISTSSGTFLVRLLYFKDALGLILQNPFGLGYLGFRAVEGSIQTGRYFVTYVHNGFLQLLLDYGWAPAVLLATTFLQSIISRQLPTGNKLVLILLLGHCMLDYDTEFLSIWILMLSMIELEKGRRYVLSGKLAFTPIICLIVVCAWIGSAELCYYTGNADICLEITPFHTDAMTYQLSRTEEPAQAELLADRILEKNSRSSIAWTAKANAAFRRGDVERVANCKEQAIQNDRYDIKEYCDYIDKMYAAMQIYAQQKNTDGFDYCANKIRQIPNMMQEVTLTTDPLAYRTGDDPSMVLPENYQALIESLTY